MISFFPTSPQVLEAIQKLVEDKVSAAALNTMIVGLQLQYLPVLDSEGGIEANCGIVDMLLTGVLIALFTPNDLVSPNMPLV